MRGLSKVAILSVAVIAIGGQLFAPPPCGAPIEETERTAFIARSKAVIGRDWTEAEISEFKTTHVAPAEIRAQLSAEQIVEFLGIGRGAAKDWLTALLNR